MAKPRPKSDGTGGGGRVPFERALLIAFAFLLSFGVGAAYASWSLVCNAGRCPAVEVLEDYTPRQTSKLFAADGRFIAEIGSEKRTLIKLNDIPPVVRNAFLTVEDKRFYKHAGVDWIRVAGAILADIRAGGWVQGFSTISMQLARNTFPERIGREKNIIRKLKEAKVARAIEARYPKDQILELYLNQIYLGNGAHGVETAAQRYFGKSARDLSVAESATLAALPKGPERYNPRRFPDRAVQRRNTVIELMRRDGKINDADASLARAYPMKLASRKEAGDVAPFFVEWVRQELDRQFGKSLYEQGLKVFTTLDVDLQDAAERALENQLRAIENGRYGRYRRISFESYLAQDAAERDRTSANTPYLQGAFVAMDPRTGAVRAMIGGRDFGDSKFNRATQALRQPGSTFKPIVYAAAVQQGRSPAYTLDDSPLTVPMSAGNDWTPQNFDGQYLGRVPMRKSLYDSRNVSTIRLGMELGEQQVIGMARKFGLTSPIPSYPSIFIGAADVYPLEMISTYSAFATLGMRTKATAILRVENNRGEVLWAPEPVRVPVMSQEEAFLMVSMMKDVVRRGTAAGAVAGAGFNVPAGGKTGTTNDGTDVWFVGYTPDLVAGLWIGTDKPSRIMPNAQGGRLAAPAWTSFMRAAYRRKPAPPDWPQPLGIVAREVDAATGMLAAPECGPSIIEYFIAGTEPTQPCVPTSPMPYDSLGNPIDTLRGAGVQPYPQPYPPPAGQPPPGQPQQTTTPPGGVPIGRPPVLRGRDSVRTPRDTGLFSIPPRTLPRDSVRKPTDTLPSPVPRPDTSGGRPGGRSGIP